MTAAAGPMEALRRHTTPRLAAGVLLALLCLWVSAQTIRAALVKPYAIDEFAYAHAAWLVSEGEVPYRDFFDHHFPLVYQILALPFLFAGDDPEAIFVLRVLMLPVAALTALAAWHLNSRPRGRDGSPACAAADRHDRLVALLAPALMFSLARFAVHAIEIRPDALSFALFLAALSVLYRVPLSKRIDACLTPRVRGAASGFLLVASVWSSQKVFVYGLPFVAAFVVDVARNRRVRTRSAEACLPPHRQERRFLLGDPWTFLAGAAAALAPVVLYLTITRSWGDCFRFCVLWPLSHEGAGRLFPWSQFLGDFVRENLWLLPLAGAGLTETALRLKRKGAGALSDPEVILAASLPTAFASFAVQAAAYSYSLIPFVGILAIFGARGLVLVSRFLWRWRPAGRRLGACAVAVVLGLVALGLVDSYGTLERALAPGNRVQHEVLARIGEITSPADVCYDNTGCYVARPHAYFYYFTSAYMRRTMREDLARDVPAAIVERGCVLCVDDKRLRALPSELRRFLGENFQPYDGDILLWGRRYVVEPNGGLRSRFLAVQDGAYFVEPASALESGVLTVDGEQIEAPVFELRRGEMDVRYGGEAPEIHILWLPRDGKRYRPRPSLRPRLLYSLYE